MKRMLSLLLTLCMMLTVIALPVSIASAEEEDGPLTPYKEPITITWSVPASAVQ